MENYFKKLNDINVNEHTEKKNGLTYLSWAWAWSKVKEFFPDSTYTIYENSSGWNYHTDGRTCWVKTGVTVNGIEHIEYLPVMDHRNNSIPAERVTSFDVNKAIQRSLTKAVARHGLGLYIYAGEDLPESEEATEENKPVAEKKPAPKKQAAIPDTKPGWRIPPPSDPPIACEVCGRRIPDYFDGKELIKAAKLADRSLQAHGAVLCTNCSKSR